MELDKAKEAQRILESIDNLEKELKALKDTKSMKSIIVISKDYRSGAITFSEKNSGVIYDVILSIKESEIREANFSLKEL